MRKNKYTVKMKDDLGTEMVYADTCTYSSDAGCLLFYNDAELITLYNKNEWVFCKKEMITFEEGG